MLWWRTFHRFILYLLCLSSSWLYFYPFRGVPQPCPSQPTSPMERCPLSVQIPVMILFSTFGPASASWFAFMSALQLHELSVASLTIHQAHSPPAPPVPRNTEITINKAVSLIFFYSLFATLGFDAVPRQPGEFFRVGAACCVGISWLLSTAIRSGRLGFIEFVATISHVLLLGAIFASGRIWEQEVLYGGWGAVGWAVVGVLLMVLHRKEYEAESADGDEEEATLALIESTNGHRPEFYDHLDPVLL